MSCFVLWWWACGISAPTSSHHHPTLQRQLYSVTPELVRAVLVGMQQRIDSEAIDFPFKARLHACPQPGQQQPGQQPSGMCSWLLDGAPRQWSVHEQQTASHRSARRCKRGGRWTGAGLLRVQGSDAACMPTPAGLQGGAGPDRAPPHGPHDCGGAQRHGQDHGGMLQVMCARSVACDTVMRRCDSSQRSVGSAASTALAVRCQRVKSHLPLHSLQGGAGASDGPTARPRPHATGSAE